MSAKKTGTGHPDCGSPDPAAVLQAARSVRRLLRFHLDLGLDRYPASEPTRSFLMPRTPDRPGPGLCPGLPARRCQGGEQRPPDDAKPRLPAGAALRELQSEVQACTRCSLAGRGPERVRSTGGEAPRLLVVGDWGISDNGAGNHVFGPGEDEMLTRMMAAIGLSENEYHVTNVLKCYPGDARLSPDAAMACRGWLNREITILRPQLVCAMGELAARVLTGSSQPLARSHGRLHGCRCAGGRPLQVLATYHPRLLLRQQELKQVVWQDLQRLARHLARAGHRTRS